MMKKIIPALVLASSLVGFAAFAQFTGDEATVLDSCILRHAYPDVHEDCVVDADLSATDNARYSVCCLMDRVETVGDWIFIALIIVAVIFIVLGALGFITSAGDAKKADVSKSKIVYALIGIALAFLAKGLIRLVLGFLS